MTKIHLVATTFTDLTREQTVSFRIYDKYKAFYNNCAEYLIKDDLELLKYAISQSDDSTQDMLNDTKENKIIINNQ